MSAKMGLDGVYHTTVLNWVRQVGELLPDAYDPDEIPQVGELDELQTFVGSKKQTLSLDSDQSLQARNFRMGYW